MNIYFKPATHSKNLKTVKIKLIVFVTIFFTTLKTLFGTDITKQFSDSAFFRLFSDSTTVNSFKHFLLKTG